MPTARLAALAVAAAAFALVSPWSVWVTLLVINATLLAVMTIDAYLGPHPNTLQVERWLPAMLIVGQTGEVSWRVTNPSGRRGAVAVADALAPSLHADDRRFSAHLGPHSQAEAEVQLTPSRRGAFAVDELTVRVAGPLGLGARQRTRQMPSTLRVHPPFRSRDEAELRIHNARILEVGIRSTRGRGGGTEFEQLREYQHDDEFRRIDWAATARSQKPVVRTFREERNQVIVQLLDNGRVMAGRVGGVPRVEHAMDAVMMLTAVATNLGDKAGLVAFDRHVRKVVPPAAHRTQMGLVTEAMYDLEPSLHESDYRGAFMYSVTRFRRRSMLVIYTDLVEQAVGESLLPALPVLVGRHVVIVAAVQDPDVARWATETPADSDQTYRQAAALATIEDRRRATARLKALGVRVVDAPPGALAAKLADEYLDIKASGYL